jgi:hypothetical protein
VNWLFTRKKMRTLGCREAILGELKPDRNRESDKGRHPNQVESVEKERYIDRNHCPLGNGDLDPITQAT